MTKRTERPRARADGRRTGTLAEQAHERIRRALIRCDLEPGRRVNEAELARVAGVGKTPVRDAIARLVEEGLIRSIPHHGYEVTPITLDAVREVFALRVILEGSAAQLAAGHVDAKRLRQLDRLCAESSRALHDADGFDRHLETNRAFHVAVAEASGNHLLARTLARLLDQSGRMFRVAWMLRGNELDVGHHHRELIDALLTGDGEAARQIAVTQLLAPERQIIEALIRSRSLGSAAILAERSVQPRPRSRASRQLSSA